MLQIVWVLLTYENLKIIGLLKEFWNKDLGLHAHDNLNLALKNSEFAIKIIFNGLIAQLWGWEEDLEI